MQLNRTSRLLWLPLLAGVLLVAGCAMTKVAYNNADTMLRFMANDYFDLDSAQTEEVKARLARFHEWHRRNELPVYSGFMRNASQRMAKGLSKDDLSWASSAVRTRYRLLAARAVEEAAPVLVTLTPAQIAVFEKKLSESNAKYAKEFLSGDERKRERAQTKRMVGRFKEWTGDLTREQEAQVERFVRAHMRHTALRFEDRQRWQRDAVALLRQKLPQKDLSRRLSELFTQPEKRRSEEFRREDQRWEDDFAQLVLGLDRSLSSSQRAHVLQRMQRYADDFDALAGTSGKAAA
jgi:hypothetical protein